MAYPHSKAETIADGMVHLLGLSFGVLATAVLVLRPEPNGAALIYCLCMLGAFSASALYHLSPLDRFRPLLNRIDHAAIYFKIAGTYTPFVALIGTGFAYGILALVWLLAALGALGKMWFWPPNARGSLALYLGMGWLSVLLFYPMVQTLPGEAVALIVIGGVIYSLGTIVFSREALRFQNAIWHGFVLVASSCFFGAIALSLG